MRRALPVLLAGAALLAGCASPPTPSPSTGLVPATQAAPSPSATPARTPAIPAPTATPIPAPTATPIPEPSHDDNIVVDPSPTPPPLAYDWARFPRLPAPRLRAGRDTVEASAVAGCVQQLYEPADDPFGRVATSAPICRTGRFAAGAPLVAAPAADVVVQAPRGYALGAEVLEVAEVYAIVTATRGIPASIDGIAEPTGPEVVRETGFGLQRLVFAAPSEPGDYLVSVFAQLGRIDRRYRELGTVFLYRLRVRP